MERWEGRVKDSHPVQIKAKGSLIGNRLKEGDNESENQGLETYFKS